MKNKKGFTMVELLATLTIIVVLTTLAIIGVSGVRKRLENSYYRRVEKLVVSAGMEYYNDHKSSRPFRIGESRKVSLFTLVDEDYIEEVKDYVKEVCDPNNSEAESDKSYVVITKKGEKKYDYQTYLNCPNYREGVPTENENVAPNIGPGETTTATCSNMLSSSVPGNSWSKDNVTLSVVKPDDVEKYEIKKQSGSSWLAIGSITKDDNTTQTISEEGTGVYRVVAYMKNGGTCTSDSVTVRIDKTKPTCGSAPSFSSWTNGDRSVVITCSDSRSGCTKPSVSGTATAAAGKTNTSASITISDKAGNTRSCPYNPKIDKTKPTCGTAPSFSSWTNGNRSASIACSDSGSGCTKPTFSGTATAATGKTNTSASITISDKAGNTRSCPYNPKIDKTPPTCGTAPSFSSWTNGNRSASIACSDNDSGCTSSTFSATATAAAGKANTSDSITISDKAGNTKACSYNPKIDKVAPTCGTASGASSTWTSSDRTIKQACSDSNSGCVKNSYDTKYTSSTKTASVTIKDNAGNTNSCSYSVYVDKANPKIYFCKSQKSAKNRACVHDTYCVKIYYHDDHSGLGTRGAHDLKWKVSGGSEVDPGWGYNFPGNNGNDEIANGNTNIVITYTKIVDEVGHKKEVTADQKYGNLSQCPATISW
ncbi:MAG: prepilin-type N-terminal cleavage/methylation domain-containing protein [Bacilli bacterium]|nr:prepilin-type N-terminal cleavage/methylation domain-containing protein [Bacilli bacterium]